MIGCKDVAKKVGNKSPAMTLMRRNGDQETRTGPRKKIYELALECILSGVMSIFSKMLTSAILPEGTVRDETTFLILVALLAGFAGFAIYLRLRKKQ